MLSIIPLKLLNESIALRLKYRNSFIFAVLWQLTYPHINTSPANFPPLAQAL